jgi:hypothetical protein
MECPRLRKRTSQAHALGSPLAQEAELFGQSSCAIRNENLQQASVRGQRRVRSDAMLCNTNGSETRPSDAHNKLDRHEVGMRGMEISGGIEWSHRSDREPRLSQARAQGADIWNR